MKNNCNRLLILLCLSVCIASTTLSQNTIRLRISNQAVLHAGDSIFVAGNFNNWQFGSAEYRFTEDNGYLTLQIKNLPDGLYQFKCNRGNQQNAEREIDSNITVNRIVNLTSDTTINITIAAWQDDFINNVKHNTASPNVHILDTAFAMPQLGRKRRISIYLPWDYAISHKHYPVMYLHDGQNIFDESTAYPGGWGVNKCLDSLIKKGAPACIVIGIDNGPEKMTEYNPYQFENFGEGEGNQYVDFLVSTLKPFIDTHYRTLPSKINTIVAGSSMGALISYYAMLKYPEVFGKAGVFSPSFFTAQQIKHLTESAGNKLNGKLFFYIGGLEGDAGVKDMEDVTSKLGDISSAIIYSVVDPDGRQNEQAWRKWFGGFYKWIMADGFNNITTLEN